MPVQPEAFRLLYRLSNSVQPDSGALGMGDIDLKSDHDIAWDILVI